jgi:hypothetical protein
VQSELPRGWSGRANWTAAGFLGAFAASVLTVIYTGLMVEGSRSDFDSGFRSVTLAPGAVASVVLAFEVPAGVDQARLDLSLPDVVLAIGNPGEGELALTPGLNQITIELRAVGEGSGYVIARLMADEAIALERVFVTVAAD